MTGFKAALMGLSACVLAAAPRLAHAETLTPLYQLHAATDGAVPYGTMLAVPNAGNTGALLYGVTYQGGSDNGGTLFSFDTATGIFTTLYNFVANSGPHAAPILVMQGSVPYLYGTTAAIVFKFNLNTHRLVTLHAWADDTDGNNPAGGLLQVGNRIYGTTTDGGAYGQGRIFWFPVGGGVLQSLASLDGAVDGGQPVGTLIKVTLAGVNYLYGNAAVGGGAFDCGTVYRASIPAGVIEPLHAFTHPDGCRPAAALVKLGGRIFGTTFEGGMSEAGAIFSLDLASPASETVVQSFDGANGDEPSAGLTRLGNHLYGTANGGGRYGVGEVFRIRLSGKKLVPVFAFSNGEAGAGLMGSLVNYGNTLYGAASSGGEYGAGVIYSVTRDVPPPR